MFFFSSSRYNSFHLVSEQITAIRSELLNLWMQTILKTWSTLILCHWHFCFQGLRGTKIKIQMRNISLYRFGSYMCRACGFGSFFQQIQYRYFQVLNRIDNCMLQAKLYKQYVNCLHPGAKYKCLAYIKLDKTTCVSSVCLTHFGEKYFKTFYVLNYTPCLQGKHRKGHEASPSKGKEGKKKKRFKNWRKEKKE